jgi:hypothetical protein
MRYIIILSLFLISCPINKKNPSGLNPSDMTEEDLYHYYGLEAPQDAYEFIYKQIEPMTQSILREKTISNLMMVFLDVDSFKISEVKIHFSDYSDKVEKVILNSLIDKKPNFQFFENKKSVSLNFRLDIEKLCKGKDFSAIPPKVTELKFKRFDHF